MLSPETPAAAMAGAAAGAAAAARLAAVVTAARAGEKLVAGDQTKWGWACRGLDSRRTYPLLCHEASPPRVADVALFCVEKLGHHARIQTAQHERLRLYPGDRLLGVFGNRYATDAFEAEVRTADDLHVVTSAGMVGTVVSRHRDVESPTRLSLVGYLGDATGSRINLKSLRPLTLIVGELPTRLVLVAGTGMNSGKTTAAARLVKSLLHRGARVAACKITGSVCHSDLFELRSTAAHDVRDFSDYGFPSTYQCHGEELVDLFHAMLSDCARVKPDVVVMEVADGILQRETRMLLVEPRVRQRVAGVLLAAPCASSALLGVSEVERCGHRVLALTGVITNSPLYMREFTAHSPVPVASSAGDADVLADVVLARLGAVR